MSEFKIELVKDVEGVTDSFGLTKERSKELKTAMSHAMVDIMASDSPTVNANELLTAFTALAKTQKEAYYLIFYAGTRLEKIESGNIEDLY